MDYDTHDYIPTRDHPNAYVGRAKNAPAAATTEPFVVHPDMVPVIEKLTLLRPRWKYVSSRYSMMRSDLGVRYVYNFEVYDNGEKLGDLDMGISWRKGQAVRIYQYDTERLRKVRQRGGWTSSANIDTALKGIIKHFVPKNTTEQLTDRLSIVRQKLTVESNRAGQKFRNAFGPILDGFPALVMNNWDTMSAVLREHGMAVPTDLPEIHADVEANKALYDALTRDEGVVIYLRGTDYLTVRATHNGPPKSALCSSEELAPNVRRALGMLKLTEVGQPLPGVGMRCAPDTYFVMDSAYND